MRARTYRSNLFKLRRWGVLELSGGQAPFEHKHLIVLLLICLTDWGWSAATAYAHSQPGVSGILDENATGVQVVRLYQGLVRRDGSAWRFVCSRSYGGADPDSTAAGPTSGLAGSLPGDGVAIALPVGIAFFA